MKILITSNSTWNLYNFRLNFIKSLIKKNNKIYVLSKEDSYSSILKKEGCKIININFSRKNSNFLENFKIFFIYFKIIYKIQPNVIFSYNIKPNIYSGLVSRLLNIVQISTITGLGTFYLNNNLLKYFVIHLYKFSLKKNKMIFFHNSNDLDYFKKLNINKNNLRIVAGSGVDLKKFKYSPFIKYNNIIIFTMFSRIISDKGVNEYVEAAKIIKNKKLNKKIIFNLIGNIDFDNKTAINKIVLEKWVKEKFICHQEFSSEIYPLICKSNCIVLPSYREGMSKILIESCAVGRPVITTNVPGCKEVVEHGYNGFLCLPANIESLVDSILKFINLTNVEKNQMSLNAFNKAKLEFDEKKVVDTYIKSINKY